MDVARHVRRRRPVRAHGAAVKGFEPLVGQHLIGAVRPEALRRQLREQPVRKVLELEAEVPRRVRRVRHLHLLCGLPDAELERGLRAEGRRAAEQLEDGAPEAEPVHGGVVPQVVPGGVGLHHLGSHVPARPGLAVQVVRNLDGQAEIRDACAALAVDEDVLGLAVPVDEARGVDVLQTERHAEGVVLHLRAGQDAALALGQEQREVAARREVENEEDVVLRREAVRERHDEGAVNRHERRLLVRADLEPLLRDALLAHALQGVHVPRRLALAGVHGAEAAPPDDAEDIEVLVPHGALLHHEELRKLRKVPRRAELVVAPALQRLHDHRLGAQERLEAVVVVLRLPHLVRVPRAEALEPFEHASPQGYHRLDPHREHGRDLRALPLRVRRALLKIAEPSSARLHPPQRGAATELRRREGWVLQADLAEVTNLRLILLDRADGEGAGAQRRQIQGAHRGLILREVGLADVQEHLAPLRVRVAA
mmetsp:Transcript_41251/g.129226  ORF Transcript_41251/g.129226 Transcript_41251/m.129226 type:complete len:482 (-) Transcript_41251:728-2173(-)